MREFLRELLEVSTKHIGLELFTHKRKSRQPQSVQHFSLLQGGARSVTRCGARASSDELNNKRCKYDNFSQDVASNNKIKIILKVSKVTEKELTQEEDDSLGERGRSRTGFAVTTALRVVSCVCVCVCVQSAGHRKIFNSSHPSCSDCLPACLPALLAFLLLCLPAVLSLVLAYVKEQLRRLLLLFVPCQFNWFVFYAKEDYTSSWRRLQLNLCGRPASRPVLSTPAPVLCPEGWVAARAPWLCDFSTFVLPKCRSIHLPPAAQVSCLIRLCSQLQLQLRRVALPTLIISCQTVLAQSSSPALAIK